MFSKTQLGKGTHKRCKICVNYNSPLKSDAEIEAKQKAFADADVPTSTVTENPMFESQGAETKREQFSGFDDVVDSKREGAGGAAIQRSANNDEFKGFEEIQPVPQSKPSPDGYLEVTGKEEESGTTKRWHSIVDAAKANQSTPPPVVRAVAAPAAAPPPRTSVEIVKSTARKTVPSIGRGVNTKTPTSDPESYPDILISFFPDAFGEEYGTAFANALVNGLVEASGGKLTCFHRRMGSDKLQDENGKEWQSEWTSLVGNAKVGLSA